MVAEMSRMKQADSAAHSSGCSGGARRVLDCPAAGVLQNRPTATDPTWRPSFRMAFPNDAGAQRFRHLTNAHAGITDSARFRATYVKSAASVARPRDQAHQHLRIAAVDQELLAGDEARAPACEKQHRVGD